MFGVIGQVLLGIVTVLNQVPIPLGLAHQLWAFGLLAMAIWHLYEVERYIAGRQTVTTWTANNDGQRDEHHDTNACQPLGPAPARYAPGAATGAARPSSAYPTPPRAPGRRSRQRRSASQASRPFPRLSLDRHLARQSRAARVSRRAPPYRRPSLDS